MKYKWFYRGDLDGAAGLFIDNLLQLMLINVLCQYVVQLPQALVVDRILPGAALSILIGNAFYALQAKRLAERSGRIDTTALPYGINTVSLFAHIFLIMAPVFRATQNADLAWKAGLFACLGSALIELFGAFIGSWLRRHTPRAALLTALAGIALTFIAMGFVFQIFANPLLALLPAFLILFVYGSGAKLPLAMPGGLFAVLIGCAIAWLAHAAGHDLFTPDASPYQFALHLPQSSLSELLDFIVNQDGWKYLSIIVPMGLFNVIGSLQNLESAEAAGDRYDTRSSLLANGIGGLSAALLGSPFPTTIYIGHPGWKAMGARWGYSMLNGLLIAALCLTGAVTLVQRIVPLEATLGILLWIGLVIAAQAYREVPREHYLGVAFGFIPTLAAWLLLNIETTLRVAGTDLYSSAAKFGNNLYIHGILALNQGFIITSMIFAAVMVYVVERRFARAALWCGVAALASYVGLIHAYELTPLGAEGRFGWNMAPAFSLAYAGAALCLLALKVFARFAATDIPESHMARAFEQGERRGKVKAGATARTKRSRK